MQISSVSTNTVNQGSNVEANATSTIGVNAMVSPTNALMDIQSMLDKISLMFKSLRDQTQDRQVAQKANSFQMIEAKMEKKKAANDAEIKAGYLSAGLSIGGAVAGGIFGGIGLKNAVGTVSKSTLASQFLPKLTEAGGGFADASIRQNEVNPNRLMSETISAHQEIYDKDRERTENKADEFARQVLKVQESINTIYREFTNAATMK